MKAILQRLHLAPYGGDELFLATLTSGSLAWLLYTIDWAPFLFLLALGPWLFVLYFFRDPRRTIPDDPHALLSPADGTVMDIEEVEEPSFLECKAIRIGIFLSPLNVHVNRSPTTGTVCHLKYRAGEFLPAYNPQAPTRNESFELGLVLSGDWRFLVKQISGVVARRIVCGASIGQVLARGERYGMIKFGSRTELYVPMYLNIRPLVKVGQKVCGGETILAHLPEHVNEEREATSDPTSLVLEHGEA